MKAIQGLCILLAMALQSAGQPALPMSRQVLWIQPNPTNVGGYELLWGTNRLMVSGVTNTSAVIELQPGQQTLLLRATAVVGTNDSVWVTNELRMLKLTLEGATAGADGPWAVETNWTWAIVHTNKQKWWRTRMEWSR